MKAEGRGQKAGEEKLHNALRVTAGRKKLWLSIAVLIILTPIGLLLPKLFKAGGAWGEWNADQLKDLIGYIPSGLNKLSGLWRAPVHDYLFRGLDKGAAAYVSYLLSGLFGVVVIVAVVYIFGKIVKPKQ